MKFCTSIHCIDGRIQEPIIKYLKGKFSVEYVDAITEGGPCGIFANCEDEANKGILDSLLSKINMLLAKRGTKFIAISGHYDCLANPLDKEQQIGQIKKSVEYLKEVYPNMKIIGLWVNSDWEVEAVNIPSVQ